MSRIPLLKNAFENFFTNFAYFNTFKEILKGDYIRYVLNEYNNSQ